MTILHLVSEYRCIGHYIHNSLYRPLHPHNLLFAWGATVNQSSYANIVDELPKIWLRLAKIPALYKILADKGFADTERDYPNFNQVETPTKLAASKGCRKSQEHIKRDRPLTRVHRVLE